MLQIVTKRRKKLKKICKITYLALVYGLLNACSATNLPPNTPPKKTENTYQIQIEPQKGRISPDISVARSLKYNTNSIKQQSITKFIGEEAYTNAFNNLKRLKENNQNSISTSLKELDFSILFASVNYYQDNNIIDSLFDNIIAQNLIQGTLKSHKNTLYANKKIFEIRRKIRQYQKQLTFLIKKQSQNPTDFNSEYKKTLETAIDKLKQIQKEMEQNIHDFKQLTKIDNNNIKLEGKNFFSELNLPANSQASDFQTFGLSNRSELQGFNKLSYNTVSELITYEYPINDRKIKGFYLQDSTYLQNLAVNGDAQAHKLLETIINYQQAPNRKKNKIKEKLEKEFNKAIYLQIELAYALALRTSADYQAQQTNIENIKKEIKYIEKNNRLSNEQKIQLIQLHINLLENENIADQILGEKAVAVSALNFYAGLNQISPSMLNNDIATLSQEIKKMLSQKISDKQNISSKKQKNTHWAKGDNWLEELMTTPQKTPSNSKIMSKPVSSRIDYNKFTILQMGAYLDKSTAENEWKKLSSEISELQKYQPVYEKNYITGIELIRLYIKSPNGGLKDLCSQLRKKHYECILRD